MATVTGVVVANGAVGFTGLTRATVVVKTAGTSIVFEVPKTFILKGFIPAVMKADGSAAVLITALTYSSADDQYTATAASALDVGAEIILIGELGRRDVPAENPQGIYTA